MTRVLLTGAGGFVGRHCLSVLARRGYEVHAVSSRALPADAANIHWHRADLLDPGAVAALMADLRPSHLLHLAWYVAPGKYWSSPENLRWVQASLGLVQEFQRQGGRRVVMAGTCAEYDWRHGYCSETVTPLAPATLYGVCKHGLQLMLTAFANQTGLSAAWGRIFFLFGPHEPPERLVAYVIRSLLCGQPARCSHSQQVRDFLYVDDVAEAFIALLESDVAGPVNIGSGKPVALRELIHKIAGALRRPDLIEFGALPAPADDPRWLVADVARLTDEVGWSPEYSLDRAVELTIDWWRGQLAVNERDSAA